MTTEHTDSETEPASPTDDGREVRGALEFSIQRFVFEAPLYEVINVKDEDDIFPMFSIGASRVDGYCLFCKNESVFHTYSEIVGGKQAIRTEIGGYQTIYFQCARCKVQKITLCVLTYAKFINYARPLEDIKIFKIGQWPTHADLANKKLNEYAKVLSKLDRAEISRANGIAAHGVNIGAFVYLRRVFERLIYRAFERAGPNMKPDEFSKLRMPEKIDTLKDHLPKFVSENKNMGTSKNPLCFSLI